MQKNTLATIIFSLSIFLFFVLVLPQYDTIKMTKEAIKLRQSLLAERTAEFNKVKDFDNQIRARQSDISKIRSFLPKSKQLDEIVSSVQNISETSGLQLTGMTAADVPSFEDAAYKKVLIGLDLVGQYPTFVNALRLVEQSLRLYDVSEIVAAASTVVLGNIDFTVKINAYYLK